MNSRHWPFIFLFKPVWFKACPPPAAMSTRLIIHCRANCRGYSISRSHRANVNVWFCSNLLRGRWENVGIGQFLRSSQVTEDPRLKLVGVHPLIGSVGTDSGPGLIHIRLYLIPEWTLEDPSIGLFSILLTGSEILIDVSQISWPYPAMMWFQFTSQQL